LGGECEKSGASFYQLPGSEISSPLQTARCDATGMGCPYNDLALVCYKSGEVITIYPGWHELGFCTVRRFSIRRVSMPLPSWITGPMLRICGSTSYSCLCERVYGALTMPTLQSLSERSMHVIFEAVSAGFIYLP